MDELPATPRERIAGLRRTVEATSGPILVMGHNYPDPDCLAAALGVQCLLAEICGRRSRLSFGGGLGRAENRAMAGLLEIEFEEAEEIDPAGYAGQILVDTQPGSGNNRAPAGLRLLAVFDHHEPPPDPYDADWADVRTSCGASSTILEEYLAAAGVAISPRLATALLVGIRTDTEDLERDETEADVEAYLRLYRIADRGRMRQIMRPVLSEAYFSLLHRALERARRWGDAVVADLGPLPAPDLLSEVSELFARLKGVDLSLACGVYEGRVHFSLRGPAVRPRTRDLLSAVVGDRGSAGGHGRAAGGSLRPEADESPEAAADRFCRRFVEGLDADKAGPRPVTIADESGSA